MLFKEILPHTYVEAKLPRLFWWSQRLLKIHSNKIKEIKEIQVEIQEKTQDMQEPQEKHQDKYKKNFSKKRLNNTICPKEFFKIFY